jgi:hypothetical protein
MMPDDLVVCIDTSGYIYARLLLEVGRIYTVRYIDDTCGVRLHEVNPPGYDYWGWHPARFRPVHKPSIECFTKLIEPVLEDA